MYRKVEKYNAIRTYADLEWLDSLLMEGETAKHNIIAIDTETNGLLQNRSTVVGLSLAFNHYSGFYIPLLDWNPDLSYKKSRTKEKIVYPCVYPNGNFKCVWTGEEYQEFVEPQQYKPDSKVLYYLHRWLKATQHKMWNAPFDINMMLSAWGVDYTNNLVLDGSLLAHLLNENELSALKLTAERYKTQLGINPHAQAAQEKAELFTSIINNGGEKSGQVWRGKPEYVSKYACADAFLTFGLCDILLEEYAAEAGPKGLKWFFQEEVMPLCKEVVINMNRRGAKIDVPHFEALKVETGGKLDALEDKIVQHLESQKLLNGFNLGDSLEKAVSNQRLVKRIIELENLAPPLHPKTGKLSLAKPVVKKAHEENPHWLWGYVLGEDEIKYTDAKLLSIKQTLYQEVKGKRYRFNIGSDDHLKWLFCEKLGYSKSELPQTDSATKANPIPSMKAEVLKEHMLGDHAWVKDLLLFKKLSKLQSTYIIPALNMQSNGWLYVSMRQAGTKMGRFACSGGYNLQTLPQVEELDNCPVCDAKNVTIEHTIKLLADMKCGDCGHLETNILCSSAIKIGFVAPEGYQIVTADYASLEPRAFACESGDDKLKAVYRDCLDLYSKIYCDMFPDGAEYSADPKADNFLKKVAPKKRKFAKPFTLSIPYGATAYQIAMVCGFTYTHVDKRGIESERADIPRGQELIDTYLATYPDLHAYMLRSEDDAMTLGYVKTLLGRTRHFQYGHKINVVLKANSIDWRDIADAPVSKLKEGQDVWYASRVHPGTKVLLTAEILTEIRQMTGISMEKIVEKDYWGYIRYLIKADVNEAKNCQIQGLAAHIANQGMLITNRLYLEKGVDGWIFLQVHDEISTYVLKKHVDLAIDCMRSGMENNYVTAMLDIPMVAEPTVCDTLKDAK